MLWRDLREYLDRLEQLGDLLRVTGANWEEEIGGISELMIEQHGPALLFDEIPGYPRGHRVAANLYTTPKRTAVVFGLDYEPPETLAERWLQLLRDLKPIPPAYVESGPIFENVLTGDAINLFAFPTPKWHEDDGGRYIGTGLSVIQKDPDSAFVNAGAYRVSVYDEQTCTLFIEPDNHGDTIRRKHWARGEKCPVVVSCGEEPILMALSGSSLYRTPRGTSEFDVAGYLHGEPYPVVRGQFTGLPIPATAEIAIEGYIPSPEQALVPEGPFGEWTGYYAHGRRPETIIEVKAIYHRNAPILFGQPPQRPVSAYYNPNFGGDDAATKLMLEQSGIPGIQRIYTLARPFLRVVVLKQQYAGHVADVTRLLAPGGEQHSGHHIWILVDEDIDPTSPQEVLWAIASRCAPESGVTTVPVTAVWQLDPLLRPEDRSEPGQDAGRQRYRADDLVLNACKPYEWYDDFPPVAINSPALRQRIREKWRHLFVKMP
ncbi:MAG TPA: UbiD family decarboxylase [Chloroflexota bacterium]|jgi:4-hydroxy-3-polyprenylbenzoate decarboxylase